MAPKPAGPGFPREPPSQWAVNQPPASTDSDSIPEKRDSVIRFSVSGDFEWIPGLARRAAFRPLAFWAEPTGSIGSAGGAKCRLASRKYRLDGSQSGLIAVYSSAHTLEHGAVFQ